MCHLIIDVDQSIHSITPVFDLLDASRFYIRSVRTVPVAGSREVSLHLSLGGGPMHELDLLLRTLRELPAVLSTTTRSALPV